MKAYSFPLQSLLTYRAHLKEQASQAWAKALAELQAATQECQQLLSELKSWQDARRKQHARSIRAGDLARNNAIAQEFYQQWVIRERLRQNLEHQARQAMQRWNDARRNEEIISRLRQRSWTSWTREQERDEQKNIDERASIQVFRRTQRPLSAPAP
ncbi:MAG: flagellar FliJ family protein [Verrucomicrobia bacterium]|nr:flagellar FliJ family protein [Verrucomicrobiota bacterium]